MCVFSSVHWSSTRRLLVMVQSSSGKREGRVDMPKADLRVREYLSLLLVLTTYNLAINNGLSQNSHINRPCRVFLTHLFCQFLTDVVQTIAKPISSQLKAQAKQYVRLLETYLF